MTEIWKLYFSKRHLLDVVPDGKYPGMWRIRTLDGTLSDMVNLSRAKDAARSIARAKHPECHNPQLWRWVVGKSALERALVR